MKTARSGFTLMEVILVLVIIAMMIGLAMPYIEGMYADVRLKAGADHIRARFAEARSHAIEEGRAYRFAVKSGEGGYKLAPDTSASWGDATATNNPGADDDPTATPPTIIEDVVPNRVTFDLSNSSAPSTDSSGYASILTFYPDGSCDNDTSFTIRLDDARPIVISVRALTATVKTEYLPTGS